MYCPNCGKENSAEQRFCRACGLSLQVISQTLVGALSEPRPDRPTELVKPRLTRGQSPLVYGFFLLVLGLIVTSVGTKVLGEKVVADVGTIISLLGVGLFGLKGVLLVLRDSRHLPPPEPLLRTAATNELQPLLPAGEPASVTEQTTRHFEPLYSERKAD